MVIVDANVLLYAVNDAGAHHDTSVTWLDQALGGGEGVGLAWTALLAFLRISTNAQIMPAPLSAEDATGQIERWLAAPAAVVVHPTARHASILAGLLRDAGTAGNLVGDAHLAALAVQHDAEIVSFDRDFARFTGVRHRLPG